MIKTAARKLEVEIDDASSIELARRARGTARIALKLLKRVRDFAQVKGDGKINKEVVEKALEVLEVDPLGLNEADRRYLLSVIQKHGGGPVGIETLASSISEDIGTVEEVIEPYLMQLGFIKRTPRGRQVTAASYKHLKIAVPDSAEQKRLLLE